MLNNVKTIGMIICMIGGMTNSMKLFSAVGGNRNLIEKMGSMMFGIGIGCFAAKTIDTVINFSADVISDVVEGLENEEEEEPQEEEVEGIEINGVKYTRVKEESNERDGSDQTGDIKS